MMRTSTELIAREGWNSVAAGAILFVVLLWTDPGELLTLLAFLSALAAAAFFRNPERMLEEESPQIIAAPVDGRIAELEAWEGRTRIVVENGLLDVHLLRAPLTGSLAASRHERGLFLPPHSPHAPGLNERYDATFAAADGREMRVALRSGGIPRPIAVYRSAGQTVKAGERYGLFPTGTAELLLPQGCDVRVAVGDHVKAGESLLAYLK